jgi:hypothetical protein
LSCTKKRPWNRRLESPRAVFNSRQNLTWFTRAQSTARTVHRGRFTITRKRPSLLPFKILGFLFGRVRMKLVWQKI